ncbi:TIGR01777 family oxidoreductase [Marinobacter sp. CHS3-4]|uniref:TIGR01777 family oxidoreductase n=1 Tax=Marinobacter sp. CHS3-4 TaxID=3045174 RepID=UPI0024B5A137|nr:TIGR01777 family oxidoreductase [Marinobacter sp. CHS3-4]MDI9245234.1 TIGR01777 family oxidoreductase [Marinobacter sp. CHS3-4]
MANKVLVTGGTGFIGQALCPLLIQKGYALTVHSRQSVGAVQALCGRVEVLNDLSNLQAHTGFDAVINLAGEGIADKRWSDSRKQALLDSRVGLTRKLGKVIASWQQAPSVIISGSAVGYYGDQGEKQVTEETSPNDEFTHKMCADWEAEAEALRSEETRVCLSRTGLVVGPGGGFLGRMLLPFKLGLGGRIADGNHFMPWIHREDVVGALIWMLETPQADGAYNVVSPNPVSNREFTRTLGKVLNRPTLFPVPAAVLKLALGEMARLLLTGQNAIPKKLEQEGFEFRYRELEAALKDATRY